MYYSNGEVCEPCVCEFTMGDGEELVGSQFGGD